MKYVKVTGPDLCNGNGNRCTLWIAGCTHACPNCHNKWLQDYSKGKALSLCKDKIYEMLSLPFMNGLTVSGGDPLDQSDESLEELLSLLTSIKGDFPEKDIWIYTGFTLDELCKKKNRAITEILRLCDYLVDGLFVEALKGVNLAFRGSSNQNIWHNEEGTFRIIGDNVFKN